MRNSRRRAAALLAAILLGTAAASGAAFAQTTLLYLELQGVAAYSTAAEAVQTYSQTPEDVMQKPSLGFDLVRRFSGRTRDIGVLAVQARLAYTQDLRHPLQLQVYNASFRLKAGFADLWAGHDRPALGLDAELDSHALLLPGPAMRGFGFDRDWGVGLRRDFAWGNAAASLTAGSGMPLYLHGNYLAAVRVSRGVLARDNWSVGLSLAGGRVLDTMGYALVSRDPAAFAAAAADATYLWRNVENRVEVLAGRRAGSGLLLVFWRAGVNLLGEGRLRLEVQPAVARDGGRWNNYLGGGASYEVTADLAARSLVQYDFARKDARFVLQLYFYKRI
ncbi:MAG TPA: hypothetical protein VMS75_10750 [Terriglobales bacterium]|nr:hypothetical protein [Terriglobales bacterium]